MSFSTPPRLRARLLKPALVALAAGLIIASVPKTSEAVPPILRPATHPMFATFGLGPAIGLTNYATQFKLEQAFGWHFGGSGEGPAIGVHLGESFGSNVFSFALGPRFWYDIQPMANLGLYIAPFAQLGFALQHWSYDLGIFGGSASGTNAAFNMIFGAEARLAIGNRGMVFFRPIAL
ncbi:MAG: hypothetical protein KAI47_13640, partial [Deltaproteobacteria bacterium]|nr:hypothetical protein [Deltaproteobacteria bacterium]